MTTTPHRDDDRPGAAETGGTEPDAAQTGAAETGAAEASAADGIREPGDPNGEWWVDGPIFSTEHKGVGITALRPGAPPGRFTGSMIARLAFTFLFWTGFAFLVVPRIIDPIAAPAVAELPSHWWWYVIVVLAVAMMVGLGPTFGFTRRAMSQFGQLGLPAVVTATVITTAFLIALLLHLAIDVDYIQHAPAEVEFWQLPDIGILQVFLGVAAMGALALLIALPFSIRFAVRTQRRIVIIRTTGTRYAGRLEQLEFRHERIGHLGQFAVHVGFDTPEGHRVVAARMETHSERVPLVGEPLLVIVAMLDGRRGPREGILIEPDPDRPLRFDPDSSNYVVIADGGGGA